jgi:hypothetical protein
MRRPLRKAALWFLAAALGAVGLVVGDHLYEQLGDLWAILLLVPCISAILFGVVLGSMSLLAAFGEWRLRRGVNALARWAVEPAAWESFRAVNDRRGAEGPNLTSDYTPQPAEGRAVEVIFGRRSVIVDGYYSPLRRFAIPELLWVNWLARPGEPECLEFGLLTASETTGVRTALRVPVPPASREAGVMVFHHFHARAPKLGKVGLAFRRPWLVIGWSLGVAASCALIGGVGWLMMERGDRSEGTVILTVAAILSAVGALFIAALVALIVQPWRKRA